MLISHAQNFEDVILMRAFKNVKKGFYIDIGAQDPVIDSVSLAFYNKGWRGIHVEPNPFYAAKLRNARPDEEVVEAVVGTGSGNAVFYIVGETGLSTGRKDIVRAYDKSDIREINVPIISLAKILKKVRREVHWLKIDVEGMEASVLESWSGSDIRPWVIVIESTLPNSQKPAHEAWEGMLLSRGYSPVYFDGVNKFYVHKRRAELQSVFGPGPNCFDEFKIDVSSGYVDKPQLVELEQKHQDAIERIEKQTKQLDATRESEAKSYAAAIAEFETKQKKWNEERIAVLAQLAHAQSERVAADSRVSELVAAHGEAANAHAEAMARLDAAQQEWHAQRSSLVAELDEARNARVTAERRVSELVAAHSEATNAHAAAMARVDAAQQEWHAQRSSLVAELDEARNARVTAERRVSELLAAHSEATNAHAAAMARGDAAQQEWHTQRSSLVAELDEARNARVTAESRVGELLTAHGEAAKAHAAAMASVDAAQQEWHTQRSLLVAELDEARSARITAESRVSKLLTAHEEVANAHAVAVAALELGGQEWERQRILIEELEERIRVNNINWSSAAAASELSLSQAEAAEQARIVEFQVAKDVYEKQLYELWVDSVGLRNQVSAFYNSFSWRITRPFRIASTLLRKAFRLIGVPRIVGRALFQVAAGNPRLKRLTTKVLRHLPAADRFARSQLTRATSEELAENRQSALPERQLGGSVSFVQQNPPIISSRAKEILACFEHEYANKGVGTDASSI